MNGCLWCGKTETEKIRLQDLISLTKIEPRYRCRECTQQLTPLKYCILCRGCSRIWERGGYCEDCLAWKSLYPDYPFRHYALYQYNDFMKEWLKAFKFKGDYRMGNFFKEDIRQSLSTKEWKHTIIVPIPISRQSQEQRGFNQVEALLNMANVNYVSVLKHMGAGTKQSSKSRAQRMLSVQPFQLQADQAECIIGKNLLLVDDVYTTGRTLFHAASYLLEEGAANVETFSLAR